MCMNILRPKYGILRSMNILMTLSESRNVGEAYG